MANERKRLFSRRRQNRSTQITAQLEEWEESLRVWQEKWDQSTNGWRIYRLIATLNSWVNRKNEEVG